MTVPRFQEFLLSPEAAKTQLYFENTSLEVKPKLNQKLKQSTLILPPVFSHINFLLMQMLSESGYGEFNITLEKKNNQFVVYVNSHLSQRYCLDKKESETMQKAYQQTIKTWKNWWLSKLR